VTVQEPALPRILQLIDFLADYDARRNPPLYDIGEYGLYTLREAELPVVRGVALSPAADAWLLVDFVSLPISPTVPEEFGAPLSLCGSISPHLRPAAELPDDPTDGDLALAERAEDWVVRVWAPWAAEHREASQAKALYRDLFELRERLATDRDAVELVWGFGRLRWHIEGTRVDHPLVTIPVEVEMDQGTQRLSVVPAGAAEVEALCLAGLHLDDRPGYLGARAGVVDVPLDTWDAVGMSDLLRRLTRAIDHDGSFEGDGLEAAHVASVDRTWVLYLRRRRPDYQGFLDEMRKLYTSGGGSPPHPPGGGGRCPLEPGRSRRPRW
jgi:hypothetical protein